MGPLKPWKGCKLAQLCRHHSAQHSLPSSPSPSSSSPTASQRHYQQNPIPLLVTLAQPRLADGSQFVIELPQTSCMPLALCKIAHNPSASSSDSLRASNQTVLRCIKWCGENIYNLRSVELPSQFKETNLCERSPVNPPLARSKSRIPVLQLLTEDECVGSRLSHPMPDSRYTFFPAKQRLGPPPPPPPQQCRPHKGFSTSGL